MTWNLRTPRHMEDMDIRQQISFLYFNMDKALKNSTPGNVTYIRWIEGLQIDAVKFERMQIHCCSYVFTAIVIVVA